MTERIHLSDLEQMVLLAILRLSPEAYGRSIRRDLVETVGRDLTVASIQTVLARMERRGLVRSWMSEPESVRGGRSKRCYVAEPVGVARLQESRVHLDRMWAGVDPSLNPAGKA